MNESNESAARPAIAQALKAAQVALNVAQVLLDLVQYGGLVGAGPRAPGPAVMGSTTRYFSRYNPSRYHSAKNVITEMGSARVFFQGASPSHRIWSTNARAGMWGCGRYDYKGVPHRISDTSRTHWRAFHNIVQKVQWFAGVPRQKKQRSPRALQ